MKNKPNIIDRTIAVFNPRAAVERLAWRREFLRTYDAGSLSGTNSGWTPVNAPAEVLNQSQRDMLRARARDLERNADIAESILLAFERNAIGKGLRVQAKPLNKDGVEDDVLAKEMEKVFASWCNKNNCDITGESDFVEMQKMIIRRMFVDGGILLVESVNPYDKTAIPYILQMREVDEIDGNRTSYQINNDGNRIVNGIELNKYNKPVAFWLKKITPDGLQIGDSERISAERVFYLRKKQRPSQIREVSKLAPTANKIRDINEFSEAISIKERVLACLSVFIKKAVPMGGVGRGGISTTNKDKDTGFENATLAPGIVKELAPGDDIATVNPSGQASNAKEFITAQQRLISSGMGLSYEAVSRDMSQVNYSSARQGLIEDFKTYEDAQEFLKKHFLKKVYEQVITYAVLAGKLSIPDFFDNKDRYLNHSWIAPGMSWIDPNREINANKTALESNQTTLANICSANGLDWREVVRQRATEQEYISKYIKPMEIENEDKTTKNK